MSGLQISAAAAEAGLEALRSGWLTMGPRTEKLEADLVARFGSAHAVATSSGTAALHLSCIALGAGPDSEVLVPALAPQSCAGAPLAAGATPVAYDVGAVNPPEDALAEAGERCRAIIARHPLGFPADLTQLARSCEDGGIALVEDCRDALGARTDAGAEVGRSGAVAILSFASGHQVGAGEGGAVLTDDEEIAARVRSLRSHAMTSGTWDRHRGHAETYDVVDVGFNYRIDEVRAAIARAGLAAVDEVAADLRARAGELAKLGETPPGLEFERSSPLAVPLLAATPGELPDLRAAIEGAGAGALPVSLLPGLAAAGATPQAEDLAGRMLLATVA